MSTTSVRLATSVGVVCGAMRAPRLDDAHLQSCVMRYLLRYSSYNPVTAFPTAKGTTDVRITLEFHKPTKR